MSALLRHGITLAAMAGLAAAAGAADRGGAEAFLRRVYAPYLAGDAKTAPTGAAAPTIFDARLTALLRKDQAAAHGEVGALDSDPICACQDFDRLKNLAITVVPRGSGRAAATVRFVNGTTPTTLHYTLATTRAGWRVTDIRSSETPSLVALLEGTTPPR